MRETRAARKARLLTAVLDQQRWIDEHGTTIAGYVARYGSGDDPEHYGSGGELIHAADCGALDELQRQYELACGGRRR